jgi:hypothetical protein
VSVSRKRAILNAKSFNTLVSVRMNLQPNMRCQANMLVQVLPLQDLLVRVRLSNENVISKFNVVRHVNINPDIVVGDDTCNDMDVPRAMKYTSAKKDTMRNESFRNHRKCCIRTCQMRSCNFETRRLQRLLSVQSLLDRYEARTGVKM